MKTVSSEFGEPAPQSSERGSLRRGLVRALRSTLRLGVFVGGLAAVAVLGSRALSAQDAGQPAGGEEPRKAPLVETVLSEAQGFPAQLSLRGATEAARRVTVSAQTAGLVVSEPRRKGERIAKGETLCEIESGERPARLAEAKARLLEAEAVAKASAALEKKGFAAETKRAKDQAELIAARAAVATIELDIERTKMAAPFDGWLETDTAELGSLLSLGGSCATLLSLDPIRFVGYAAEAEVGKARLDQPVEARLVDGRRIKAKVSFVARAADPKTRTFRVEARAPNSLDTPGGPVRDGATATLVIAYGEREAHKAPRSALMLDSSGRLGVMLAVDGKASFKPIEIVADGPDGVWIAGLPDRAEIVVTGQYYVSDGSPLRTAPQNGARPVEATGGQAAEARQ